jgi:hypothetical protein
VRLAGVLAELLQQYYTWKLLEFFKAAAGLVGEGSISTLLVSISTSYSAVPSSCYYLLSQHRSEHQCPFLRLENAISLE